MLVLTVATQPAGYMAALEESAKRHRFHLRILGRGEPWTGFAQIPRTVLAFLTSTTLDLSELVAVVDAFDTIFVGDAKEMAIKFHRHVSLQEADRTILMGAQKDSPGYAALYGETCFRRNENAPFGRVDTGFYMGTVRAMKRFLERVCDNQACAMDSNDQNVLHAYLQSNHNDTTDITIRLDGHGDLFYQFPHASMSSPLSLLLHGVSSKSALPLQSVDYSFAHGRLTIVSTHRQPLILHASQQQNLDLFVATLGLPPREKTGREYWKYWFATHVQTWLRHKKVLPILQWFIKISHIALLISVVVGPFLFRSAVAGGLLFLLTMIVVLQWYAYGMCLLTPIEHYFEGRNMLAASLPTPTEEKQAEEPPKSFLYTIVTRVLGDKGADLLFALVPLMLSAVTLYRLQKRCR